MCEHMLRNFGAILIKTHESNGAMIYRSKPNDLLAKIFSRSNEIYGP